MAVKSGESEPASSGEQDRVVGAAVAAGTGTGAEIAKGYLTDNSDEA
jgi:hypothetical protein